MVRRIGFDWPVVLAAWALLLAATTLLTAGTLYADAVALGGLRAAVASAPAAGRIVRIEVSSRTADVAGLDARVRPELDRIVAAAGGGSVGLFETSGSFAPAAESASGTTLTILATRPGIEHHATLAAGRWPNSGAQLLEAAVSVPAAAQLGIAAGDRFPIVDRLHPGTPIEVAIVGTYRPDPADAYWLADPFDLDGSNVQGSFTTIGPLVVLPDDLHRVAPGGTVSLDWRATPSIDTLTADAIAPLTAAVGQLGDRLRVALPGLSARTLTDLPAILGKVDRSVLVGRSGVLVLVLEFAVVAAYAIVLVAGMLADRRRSETALIRTRGASGAQVAGIAFVEAAFLAGAAALLAPWISLAIVGALGVGGSLSAARGSISLSPAALGADGLAAAGGIIAMTLPNLGGVPSLAGVRAAISRQTGRTLGQRLGLDLALVTLAAVALWQLRLYGAPLTRNARGALGVDPLLVAAPGIGLLAGALLATRLLPRAAEIAEPILSRGRGLVGAIGGRAVARRPLRYTRSALLLMLAAALGTFATAHVATWTRSQADQAAYQAGSDVRITSSGSSELPPPAALAHAYAAVDGATAVMAVDRVTVDSGRSVRGSPALALDAARAGGIVAPLPGADGAALGGYLAALKDARATVAAPELPASARSLSITIDAGLALAPGSEDPNVDVTKEAGITLRVVVEDELGRLHRYGSQDPAAFLSGAGQRLTVPLVDAAASDGPPGIRRLRGLELTIEPQFFAEVAGPIDFGPIELSDAPTGAEPRTSLGPVSRDASAWTISTGDRRVIAYKPPAEHPTGFVLGQGPGEVQSFVGTGEALRVRVGWVGAAVTTATPTVAVVASDRFLELTAANVGDDVTGAVLGSAVRFHIVGRVASFPSLDPSKPFLVLDAPSVVLARYAVAGSIDEPTEWWIASTDADATAAAARAPDRTATIVSRPQIERDLKSDPVELGVIGLLGLGSLAAMAFAAIGFVVNATVSTAEREGELALLRALGLSGGQLSAWLSSEHAFLLIAGLGGGVGLGALLAWLVLPFSTLTSSGEPAIPPPAVVVPLEGLLPIAILAILVFVVTLLVLRRQLLRLRIGSALRARDE